MKSTSILVGEHCLIEQVLNCLERMVERYEGQRRLDRASARDATVFFRGFVERCHYSKVETQLPRAMQVAGVSPEACLGSPMLPRRREASSHLAAMEAAIEPASAGDVTALNEFAEHARTYIGLVLDCIARQEDRLFPMIAQTVPEAEKARLRAALDTAYANSEEECARDTYVELANRLADRFDVPRAMIASYLGSRSVEGSHR
jgi:hemerythrin-like domain-containing protein